MKLLILSWRCIKNPSAGGSEVYFNELAKRWVRDGHEVVWFSPMFEGSSKEEVVEGIKIIRSGNRASVYLVACLKYLKGDLGKNFDVVIDVENGIPFFSPIWNKCPVILHVHHVHKDQWFKQFRFPVSWIGYFLEKYFIPLVYGKKRRIITLSKGSREDILKSRLSTKEPYIVNPGINLYKKKMWQKSKTPSVLFLNRIKRYKGIEVFIYAAKILSERVGNIEFWVAGSGDDLNFMKSMAKKHKLKNVKFYGRVSEDLKRELLGKAWIFVNPSFKEGWGIVNVEANYEGTPVVGSDIGGIRDSIVENKTGLLFKPGNSNDLAMQVEKLILKKDVRKLFSKEGIEWAKRFDWDIKSKEYIKMIESIINFEATK